MTGKFQSDWVALRPRFSNAASDAAFTEYANALVHAQKLANPEEALEEARTSFLEVVRSCGRADRQTLLASGLVLSDLAVQGWQLRVQRSVVETRAPIEVSEDHAAEKARIRRQELVKRDAQLRQAAVKKFIASMERTRLFNGKFTSIFSLMRDGRELAQTLRKAREHSKKSLISALAEAIDPYLEFVSSEDATCPLTGLRLMDVWRYFRHTWSNQYTSVPGRTMMFLVRDRAASFHPVLGIGALSSPIMQIRERDTWIGWHPDTFLTRIRNNPTTELAQWLAKTIELAIAEIYIDDLREDGIIEPREMTNPTDQAIERLLAESLSQRTLHHRFACASEHKTTARIPEPDRWIVRARTHLFRSKRALALSSYLRVLRTLKKEFGDCPTAKKLSSLAGTTQGCDAIRKILRKAKADRVGIAVADITVCGAIQPYNAILGGKLIGMLSTSPEVILEYRRRYSKAESEIASSMAGRPMVRPSKLVVLGTTSLYGVGSSQYNRIKIPCARLGGATGDSIRYQEIGRSKSFGTSQYSEETVQALADLVQQSANGQRVNSIFGEGVSPKLRKIRQGLDMLGLPSDFLLHHHRKRIVYAVSLIRNLLEYLIGLDPEPDYLVPVEDGVQATARIAAWWHERWLQNRITSEDVLAEVERHTLIRPITHGARVVIPEIADPLFTDPLS